MKTFKDLISRFKPQRTSVKSDFEQFLKHYNCKWTKKTPDESKHIYYYFDFQGGHFVADVRSNDRGVEISYLGITDMPIGEISLVRTLCNHYNSSNSLIKFTYTTNEEENRVFVHMSFFNNAVWHNDMAESLEACFYYQRQFCDNYKQLKQTASDNNSDDVEADHHNLQRERFMLHQQEIHHQPCTPDDWRKPDYCLKLDTLLEKMLGLKQVKVVEIRGEQVCIIHEDVTSFDLAAYCYQPDEDGAKLSLKKTSSLTLEVNIGDDDTQRFVQLLVTPEKADVGDCVRVTATLVPESRSRRAAINSNPQLPMSNSVLVALNCGDTKQMQSEFDYMWKEAQLKQRDGEPLDELQQHIADITHPEFAYSMYWGHKFMLEGRYVEALIYLENLFNAMRLTYLELDNTERDAFKELCYCIGFCYTELRLYRDAFYYLDYLRGVGSVRYATEFINALANGKDLRIFTITDDIMEGISKQYPKEDDIPESMHSFISFMRRRRAYALIDHHQLDEAEKMFKAMLDDPENSDFALSELAYIKHLREIENNKPSNNQQE